MLKERNMCADKTDLWPADDLSLVAFYEMSKTDLGKRNETSGVKGLLDGALSNNRYERGSRSPELIIIPTSKR